MSMWNIRVIHREVDGQDSYEFAEVYYHDDGKPFGYHRPHMNSESIDGLRETQARLEVAFTKPILEYNEFAE